MNRVLVLFVFVVLLVPNGATAGETAVYRGRVYTPRTFPRAATCNCAMCRSIRGQWSRSRTRTRTVTPAVTTEPTSYRTEYRQRTRRVRRCQNGQCWYENVVEWVPVRVAVKATPPAEPGPSDDPPVKKKSRHLNAYRVAKHATGCHREHFRFVARRRSVFRSRMR